MSRIPLAIAAIILVAQIGDFRAHAANVTRDESKTRVDDATARLLRPWTLDWRNTPSWQAGNAKPRASFAPPGCYVTRLVTTCHKTNKQREFICK